MAQGYVRTPGRPDQTLSERQVYSLTSANTRKWAAALAAVRSGTRDAKILCCGDSTTTGVGSSTGATIPATKAWPAQLVALLNSYHVTAVNGLALPKSNSASQPADNRWTVGTNWATSSTVNMGWGGKAAAYQSSGVTAGNLTFNDSRITADTFDIYYIVNAGSGSAGSFSVSATGGGTTNIDTSLGGSKSVGVVTVTASAAATSNVVTIAGLTAAKAVYILGIEPYLSTAKKVRVGNAGVAGSTTTDWITYVSGTNANNYNSIQSIKSYAPDLTIFDLGINDASALALDSGTFVSQLQQLIAAAQVTGDVILKTMLPSQTTATAALEAKYVAALKATGLPVLDAFSRAGSYASNFTNGFANADGVHGTDIGYQDQAGFVFAALRTIA